MTMKTPPAETGLLLTTTAGPQAQERPLHRSARQLSPAIRLPPFQVTDLEPVVPLTQ